MLTQTSLRVTEIVNRLKQRIQPQNYGHAKAIEKGEVAFHGGDLIIIPPQIDCNSVEVLPYYACGTVSRLVSRECQLAGIEALETRIDVPIIRGEDREPATLGHMIVKVIEGKPKIVGLTSPIDRFLGIEGETEALPPWIDQAEYSVDRSLAGISRMCEPIRWAIFEEETGETLLPLNARAIGNDRLAISNYAIACVSDRIAWHINVRVLSRRLTDPSLDVLWDSNLLVGLPNEVRYYPKALSMLLSYQEQSKPAQCAIAKEQGRLTHYEERDCPLKDERYRELSFDLFNDGWPALTSFFKKLAL